jgi:hypothetical protein
VLLLFSIHFSSQRSVFPLFLHESHALGIHPFSLDILGFQSFGLELQLLIMGFLFLFVLLSLCFS